MSSYTYILGVDFVLATNIDLAAFQNTISGSSISSSTIQYGIRSGTSVALFFSGTLSGGDITTLNGLVANYIFIAPTTLVYVDTTTVQTVTNKQLTTSNTIIDPTVTTKILGFSLTGMASSTQLTLSSTISANRIYTFPDAGVNSNILLTNSSGTQTIASGNLAFSNVASILTLANTTGSTSSSTGALQVAGGAYFGAATVHNQISTFNGAGSTVLSTGSLYVNPTTTALTGASTYYFTYIAAPITTASTFTGSASSLFIAGAPTVTTGGTGYALNVAAGTARIGGVLQIPTGASNGYILSSDANGNASWIAQVAPFTGFLDGTVSAPGAYWISQTSTGFYRPGSGQIYISLAGTNTAGFSPTSTFSSVNLTLTGLGSTTNTLSTIYVNPTTTALTGASPYFFIFFAAPVTTASTFSSTASTVYIAGAPTVTTGGTGYALNIASGNFITAGNVSLSGTSAVFALSGTTSSITVAGTTTSTSSTTGSVLLSGGLGINTATAATSATNGGSLTTTGGIGVALASYFGANVSLSGTSAVLALSGASSSITVASTTTSTTATTGSVLLSGGLGINTATAATSATNGGSLTTAGGIAVALTSYFGANVSLSGTSAVFALSGASSNVTLANTTASTTSSTGALQVAGGGYFGANSLFNANLTLSGASSTLALSGASSTVTLANTTASTSSSTGALQVAGGGYFGANSLFNANVTLQGASATLVLTGASSKLTLANTTASTSSSTGALQVAGGAYFGTGSIFNALTTFNGTGSTVSTAATIYINPATTGLSGASNYYFTYIDTPVTTASTFTGSASTLFIAGPPTITTGGTGFALNIASGTTRVGGTLQIPTGANNGFVLKTDASGNASWASPAPTISYFNAINNATFTSNSTSLVNITTMTLTPNIAGTYWVTFTASFRVQNANTTATFDLALNGTSITSTPNVFVQNAQQNTYTAVINVVQAFNGSTDVVTARVSSSSGSSAITLTYRSIYAVRMTA